MRMSVQMTKKAANNVSGIMLYAKQTGMTSFAALHTVKKALSTAKVGHTGTLDSFADGLLVIAAGKLTRLVPYITGFDKTYRAAVVFGAETDTLDPTGQIIARAEPPALERLVQVLPQFMGTIEQTPPAYSALHVGGRRASDIVRSGGTVELSPRTVTIHSLQLLSYNGTCGVFEICCSKGTYIRSLARDIALACGSRGSVQALRRTAVGPFLLEQAAGYECLPQFADRYGDNGSDDCVSQEPEHTVSVVSPDCIRAAVQPFDADMARRCGLVPITLCPAGAASFMSGRPLSGCEVLYEHETISFSRLIQEKAYRAGQRFAVYYASGLFGGIVSYADEALRYDFVIPEQAAAAGW